MRIIEKRGAKLVSIEKRSGAERRQFSYLAHIPERRSGKDRRRVDLQRRLELQRSGADRNETEEVLDAYLGPVESFISCRQV